MGIRALVGAAALGLMLMVPATAYAHPKLKKSLPSAGARLRLSPTEISLYFSEAPETAMTSLILRKEDGSETPLTEITVDSANRFHLVAKIPRELSAGSYTVSWRTAASDGHPTSGAFEFTVLGQQELSATSANDSDTPTLANGSRDNRLASTSPADDNVETPFQILIRALSFTALIIVIGAVAFRYAVMSRVYNSDAATRAAVIDRAAVLGMTAALVLLVVSPIRFHLQAAMMPEHGGNNSHTLMTHTGWGTAWMLYTGGAALAFVGFVAARFRKSFGWMLAAKGAVVVSVSLALSGHAGASAHWVGLAVVADTLHIIGAGGWLGSLLLVVAALPILATRRGTGSNLAQLVNAFSPTALVFASLVIVTGLISAWLRLGAFSALWSSAYGRVLLLKLLALAGVVATGAYNWKRVKPMLGADAAASTFRLSARVELLIGVVVILITAILVAVPTPTDLS